jgi:hypothetical protein
MKATKGIYTNDNHRGKTMITAVGGGGTVTRGDYREGYSMMGNQGQKLMVAVINKRNPLEILTLWTT